MTTHPLTDNQAKTRLIKKVSTPVKRSTTPALHTLHFVRIMLHSVESAFYVLHSMQYFVAHGVFCAAYVAHAITCARYIRLFSAAL